MPRRKFFFVSHIASRILSRILSAMTTGVRSKTGWLVEDEVYAHWHQDLCARAGPSSPLGVLYASPSPCLACADYRAVIVKIKKKGGYMIKYLTSDNGDLELAECKCEDRDLELVENLDLIRDEDGRVVGQKRKQLATGASVASQWQEQQQLEREQDLALLSKCGPNGVVQRWLSRPGVRDKVLEAIRQRGLEDAITHVASVALDGKKW